jgi:hypothetical protein
MNFMDVHGRRYWAMRTGGEHRDFIWAEARAGRLRQGWGWEAEQDLRLVADCRAAGQDLTDIQQMAWRAHRMLETEPGGMQPGDLVVAPNLPSSGRFSVFRVAGLYRFELPEPPNHQDFGHIIPVELLAADIDRHDACVSDALRRAISLQPRLYEITKVGGDVETVLGQTDGIAEPGERPALDQTEVDEAVGRITEPVTVAPIELGRPGPVAEELFDRLLESIGRCAPEIDPQPVLVHWPHVGSNYRGTVILGQALHGWADSFRASEFGAAEGRARAIATAVDRSTERPEPFDWIATHRVRTSPFWTCARLVVEDLEPDASTPWYSRFCWMNLYPCAPDDPPGNPAGALKEAQDAYVGELLRAQIERLDARRIICFVGPYWWSAAAPAGLANLPEAPRPLHRAGRDSAGRVWIVGMHPAGASRHGWGPRAYARGLVSECEQLSSRPRDET